MTIMIRGLSGPFVPLHNTSLETSASSTAPPEHIPLELNLELWPSDPVQLFSQLGLIDPQGNTTEYFNQLLQNFSPPDFLNIESTFCNLLKHLGVKHPESCFHKLSHSREVQRSITIEWFDAPQRKCPFQELIDRVIERVNPSAFATQNPLKDLHHTWMHLFNLLANGYRLFSTEDGNRLLQYRFRSAADLLAMLEDYTNTFPSSHPTEPFFHALNIVYTFRRQLLPSEAVHLLEEAPETPPMMQSFLTLLRKGNGSTSHYFALFELSTLIHTALIQKRQNDPVSIQLLHRFVGSTLSFQLKFNLDTQQAFYLQLHYSPTETYPHVVSLCSEPQNEALIFQFLEEYILNSRLKGDGLGQLIFYADELHIDTTELRQQIFAHLDNESPSLKILNFLLLASLHKITPSLPIETALLRLLPHVYEMRMIPVKPLFFQFISEVLGKPCVAVLTQFDAIQEGNLYERWIEAFLKEKDKHIYPKLARLLPFIQKKIPESFFEQALKQLLSSHGFLSFSQALHLMHRSFAKIVPLEKMHFDLYYEIVIPFSNSEGRNTLNRQLEIQGILLLRFFTERTINATSAQQVELLLYHSLDELLESDYKKYAEQILYIAAKDEHLRQLFGKSWKTLCTKTPHSLTLQRYHRENLPFQQKLDQVELYCLQHKYKEAQQRLLGCLRLLDGSEERKSWVREHIQRIWDQLRPLIDKKDLAASEFGIWLAHDRNIHAQFPRFCIKKHHFILEAISQHKFCALSASQIAELLTIALTRFYPSIPTAMRPLYALQVTGCLSFSFSSDGHLPKECKTNFYKQTISLLQDLESTPDSQIHFLFHLYKMDSSLKPCRAMARFMLDTAARATIELPPQQRQALLEMVLILLEMLLDSPQTENTSERERLQPSIVHWFQELRECKKWPNAMIPIIKKYRNLGLPKSALFPIFSDLLAARHTTKMLDVIRQEDLNAISKEDEKIVYPLFNELLSQKPWENTLSTSQLEKCLELLFILNPSVNSWWISIYKLIAHTPYPSLTAYALEKLREGIRNETVPLTGVDRLKCWMSATKHLNTISPQQALAWLEDDSELHAVFYADEIQAFDILIIKMYQRLFKIVLGSPGKEKEKILIHAYRTLNNRFIEDLVQPLLWSFDAYIFKKHTFSPEFYRHYLAIVKTRLLSHQKIASHQMPSEWMKLIRQNIQFPLVHLFSFNSPNDELQEELSLFMAAFMSSFSGRWSEMNFLLACAIKPFPPARFHLLLTFLKKELNNWILPADSTSKNRDNTNVQIGLCGILLFQTGTNQRLTMDLLMQDNIRDLLGFLLEEHIYNIFQNTLALGLLPPRQLEHSKSKPLMPQTVLSHGLDFIQAHHSKFSPHLQQRLWTQFMEVILSLLQRDSKLAPSLLSIGIQFLRFDFHPDVVPQEFYVKMLFFMKEFDRLKFENRTVAQTLILHYCIDHMNDVDLDFQYIFDLFLHFCCNTEVDNLVEYQIFKCQVKEILNKIVNLGERNPKSFIMQNISHLFYAIFSALSTSKQSSAILILVDYVFVWNNFESKNKLSTDELRDLFIAITNQIGNNKFKRIKNNELFIDTISSYLFKFFEHLFSQSNPEKLRLAKSIVPYFIKMHEDFYGTQFKLDTELHIKTNERTIAAIQLLTHLKAYTPDEYWHICEEHFSRMEQMLEESSFIHHSPFLYVCLLTDETFVTKINGKKTRIPAHIQAMVTRFIERLAEFYPPSFLPSLTKMKEFIRCEKEFISNPFFNNFRKLIYVRMRP